MLLSLLWSLQVEYLPVAVPTEKELQNPREFADRVRSQMAKALGIVCTDHSFLDIKLALAAQKLKQPQGSSMVEYARVEKLFRLDIATAQEYLAKFSAMDATHRCFIYPPPQGMKEWQSILICRRPRLIEFHYLESFMSLSYIWRPQMYDFST